MAAGCSALLSFGVAGGLDPALASGTLVLAGSVIDPDSADVSTDPAWCDAVAGDLLSANIEFVRGAVVGTDSAICGPGSKRNLFDGTKGVSVDMESHAVMRTAKEHGLPWLAVRAVADSARDTLPPIAMSAVDAVGGVRYGALSVSVLRRPSQFTDLIRLWRMSRPAFAALRRVAALPSLRGPL